MIVALDSIMAARIEGSFGISADRIVWGPVDHASHRWIRRNNGNRALPYASFYRTLGFHPEKRAGLTAMLRGADGRSVSIRGAYARAQYQVEHFTENVSDQIDLVRKYMLWAASGGTISVTDGRSLTWTFAVEFEDPEDNSDLEAEEETGRLVRTTLPFAVDLLLVEFEDPNLSIGPISDILSRIHGYDNIPGDGVEFVTLNLS